MTLKRNVMVGFILALFVTCTLIAGVNWYFAHDGMNGIGDTAVEAMKDRARGQLESIRSAKALHIEDLFQRIRNQTRTLAESLTVRGGRNDTECGYFTVQGETTGALDAKALRGKLTEDYAGANYLANPTFATHARTAKGYAPRPAETYLPKDANGIILQAMYVAPFGQPQPAGEKHRLDANPLASTYNTLHRKYHPILRNYLTTFGYYDIFIIDAASGVIVYTVFKEKDYATSLLTGPYRDTGLGAVFREAVENGRKGRRDAVSISDFAPYEPSYNAPAAFIAAPVFDDRGTCQAVLAFQMPVDNIDRIMTSNGRWQEVGLGTTGETYLVGPDMHPRSKLRAASGASDEVVVDSEAAPKALGGESGTATIRDYRGKNVLAAWQPLRLEGLHYGLIAEIDIDEALLAASKITAARQGAEARTLWGTLLVLALGTLLGSGIAIRLVGALSRPLQRLQVYAGDVAAGNLDARPEGQYPAELDAMRHSIESMVQNLRMRIHEADAKRMEAADSAQAHRPLDKARASETRIKGLMERMTGGGSKARSVSEHVSRSINDLTAQVHTITQAVETQRHRMDDTAQAMDTMRTMVSDVADNWRAAEQADLSRGHGSRAPREWAAVASIGQVRERIERLNTAMARLGEEADSIGKVMSVISDIADQTNLLALNAAIEAARAGDAGRGFAVVADEVRKLAEKTMQATGEVGSAVTRIQTHTRDNIAAVETAMRERTASADATASGRVMDDIVSRVDETAGMVQSIAAASDQQAAAATMVGRNVEEVNAIAGDTAASMSHFAGTLEDIFSQVQELFSMIEVISTGEEGVSVLADTGDADVLVKWSEDLANLPSIDTQHKRLVDYINDLYRAARRRDMDKGTEVFDALKNYAVEHFGYEERLFADYAYPEATRHKEIHRRFVETVLKWEKQLAAGDPEVVMTTLRGLVDWLVNHIMKEDKKYEAYLRERGVS
uniref:DcrH n=1 Tax=Nitratidesulfovibrio vulgaris TaxID=881 RepID=Q46583_NITVL|nr:DcrH [Nitratidesulfovibrio vulgaris str. Hildenborough]